MTRWLLKEEERVLSLADAEVLISEIDHLRGEVARLEARISSLDQLAHQDPLVGLLNRRSFLSAVERVIARVALRGGPAAMLFVDVDGLKGINDQFGHKSGDAALIEIANLLVASVRKGDFLGRLGGDEFGILLEHADELTAWQMALRVVETVVGAQFCVDDKCLRLSVAIGVTTIQAGDTPQAVFDRADQEMYRIKRASPANVFRKEDRI